LKRYFPRPCGIAIPCGFTGAGTADGFTLVVPTAAAFEGMLLATVGCFPPLALVGVALLSPTVGTLSSRIGTAGMNTIGPPIRLSLPPLPVS